MTGDTSYFQKLTEGLTKAYENLGKSFKEVMFSLDEKASSVVGKMGQSRDFAVGLQQSLSLAVPELQLLSQGGDDFAEALKKAADAQTSVLDALNTNILLTSRQLIGIAQVTQAYSLQQKTVEDLIEGLVTAGDSVLSFPQTMEDTANYARSMGVNVSAVFEMVQRNIGEINRYGFKDGVEGLGRMAARSAQMRIDMKGIFDLAESVFNPEDAIGMVATFQKLGVAAGDLADPFRLMYLAREDTEEFGKQVTKLTQNFTFFDEKTKTFKLFPNAKADLRDLATATKIPYEDLTRMSQSAERLRIIGKDIKLGNVDDETKQLIASVAQYDKDKGGFTIKLNQEGETKLVSEIKSTDIESIKQANRELSAKEIAQASMDTNKTISANVAAIRAAIVAPVAGARINSSVQEVARGTARAASTATLQIFSPERTQESLNRNIQSGLSSINDLITGKKGMKDIVMELSTFGGDFTQGLKTLGTKLSEFNYSAEIKKEILPGNQLTELGTTLTKAVETSMQSLSKAFGVDTKGLNLNQTINQSATVKGDIKVDVTGDVNLKGTKNESVNVTPELKTYIEGIVKQQLEQLNKGQMNLKPSESRT